MLGSAIRKLLGAPDPISCPRRQEIGGILRENADFWRADGTCSYCGSMKPDDVMDGIDNKTVTVCPTDKNYKAYIEIEGKSQQMKVYFQHFSREQALRFIDQVNAGIIQFEYPGHFYVKPFWMGDVKKDQ